MKTDNSLVTLARYAICKRSILLLLFLQSFIYSDAQAQNCTLQGAPVIESLSVAGSHAAVSYKYTGSRFGDETIRMVANGQVTILSASGSGRCGQVRTKSVDTGLDADKIFELQVCVKYPDSVTEAGSCGAVVGQTPSDDNSPPDPPDDDCEQLVWENQPEITNATGGGGHFKVWWEDNADIEDGYRLTYSRRSQFGISGTKEKLYPANTTYSGEVVTNYRGILSVQVEAFNDCESSTVGSIPKLLTVEDPGPPPPPHWNESIESPQHRRKPPAVRSAGRNGRENISIMWEDQSHFEEGYIFLYREKGKKSAVFGGRGGDRFTVYCENPSVLIGIVASYGSVIDSMVGICAKVKSDGTWHQISRTHKIGGDKGDEEVDLRCPNGSAVRHARVHYNNFANKIEIRCRKLNNIEENSGNLMVAGRGTGPKSGLTSCDNGFARGLYGKDGRFVDAIGLVCQNELDWRIVDNFPSHDPVGYSGRVSSGETTEYRGPLSTDISLLPIDRISNMYIDYEFKVCGYGEDYRNPFGSRQIGSWPSLNAEELDHLNLTASDYYVKGCSNTKKVRHRRNI